MRGLGDRPQRAALVEGDGEDRLGIGEYRVQIDARDLRAVLVEGDVAHEVLGERRMDAAGADRDGDLEPLPPLDLVRSLDLRRVLLVVRAADLPELRRELLRLTLGAHPGGAGDEDEGDHHGEDGRRLGVAHEPSPQFSGRNLWINAIRSRGLYGLARYAEAPASIALRSSPLRANDVTTTSGMLAVRGSARSRRVASSPDSFGSWTSIKMRSGSSRLATASPSSPSAASSRR